MPKLKRIQAVFLEVINSIEEKLEQLLRYVTTVRVVDEIQSFLFLLVKFTLTKIHKNNTHNVLIMI